VGNAYPYPTDIVNANLDNLTGNNIPSLADRIFLFTAAGTFDQVFRRLDGEWRKTTESTATTERFEVGEGFWMNIRSAVIWNFPPQ